LFQGLCAGLWGEDELTQRRVVKEWSAWGAQVALGNLYTIGQEEHVTERMLKQVKMELHYAKHHYFIDENQILNNCHLLQDIPTTIIHGRYDLVCPIEAASSLHKALPHAEYRVLPNSGHIAKGDEMIAALVDATDNMAEKKQW
jgi:proline iminopeptidase